MDQFDEADAARQRQEQARRLRAQRDRSTSASAAAGADPNAIRRSPPPTPANGGAGGDMFASSNSSPGVAGGSRLKRSESNPVLSRFKSVDFWRKIPHDISEASALSGAISLLGALALLTLFVYEFNAFMRPTEKSTVVLAGANEREWGMMVITFNFTFPVLQCAFLSVDLKNVMGDRRHNVSTSHVEKRRIQVRGQHIHAVAGSDPNALYGELPPAEAAGLGVDDADQRKHRALEHEHDADDHEDASLLHLPSDVEGVVAMRALADMAAFLDNTQFAMVMFYAPWCIWCRRLAPTWREAGKRVVAEKEFFGFVRLGKVDCTDPRARELCMKHGIMSFPSVLVFKGGSDAVSDAYHGDRTADAILGFAKEEWDHLPGAKARVRIIKRHLAWEAERAERPEAVQNREEDWALEEYADEIAEINEMEREELALLHLENRWDSADAEDAGHTVTEGCQVSGALLTRSVPGSLVIAAVSPAHSFDRSAVNVTHAVEHLSFTPIPFTPEMEAKAKAMREAKEALKRLQRRPRRDRGFWSSLGRLLGLVNPVGAAAYQAVLARTGHHAERVTDQHPLSYVRNEPAGSLRRRLDGKWFVSSRENVTHEHYLKVVPYLYDHLGYKKAHVYKYLAYNNEFHGESRMPVVEMRYDISEMGIESLERYAPSYRFATSMCAIIGGVFTVIGLFDASLFSFVKMVSKKRIGKAA